MIFSQEHLREVADSDSIHKTLAGSSKHLNSINAIAQSLDASKKLALKKRLTEVLINME